MRVRRFLLLVITLVTAGWLSKHAVWAARCDAELEVVSEPSGWHSWPLASGLAGYEVTDLEPIHFWADGWTSPRPHGLGKPARPKPQLRPATPTAEPEGTTGAGGEAGAETGGTGGTAGTAIGGTAGTSDTAGEGGEAGSSPSKPPDSDDDGGCGCRVAGTRSSSYAASLFGLAMLGLARGRRRKPVMLASK